ncbi:hypothetical protein [Trichothermofontia sp.]
MPDDNRLLKRMYPGMPALPLSMLGSGARLPREAFDCRYAATPHLRKAEQLAGVVYVPPAALRFNSRSQPYALQLAWLSNDWVAAPGGDLGIEPIYCRNSVQPSIVWQVFARWLDGVVCQDGAHIPLASDVQESIRSRVFPRLGLATTDLLAGNIQPVLAMLQQSLYSFEQAALKLQLVGRG